MNAIARWTGYFTLSFIGALVLLGSLSRCIASASAGEPEEVSVTVDQLSYRQQLYLERLFKEQHSSPTVNWDNIPVTAGGKAFHQPIDPCSLGIDYTCHYFNGAPLCAAAWTKSEDKCEYVYGK